MSIIANSSLEWLETDGFGGFASGTATGIRTRRYHALLLTATTPPSGRIVLVNGFDALVETPAGSFELTSQYYSPDVTAGSGAQRIKGFTVKPWPHWIFELEDGTRIEQEILVPHASQLTLICWRLLNERKAARLLVRPFLSCRDYHNLHKENSAFRFEPSVEAERVTWNPYSGVLSVVALSNGQYEHQPHWYRNFRYVEEAARGLDDTEDLAAPGLFMFELASSEAVLMLTTPGSAALATKRDLSALEFAKLIRANENSRRAEFLTRLHRSAEDYIVTGRKGKTIIAGYPWFTDWGRDTFIALRGLCLATGRIDAAREILLAWSDAVSEGMLPNRFPDHGEQPEFNAVDASLWFIIAVHEYLRGARGSDTNQGDSGRFMQAVDAILDGYAKGTRYGIRMDKDGLLSAGQPGVQLTWMDAKVGDWVVTPRIGKPVEVEALWLNALWMANQNTSRWEHQLSIGVRSFRDRFWNEERGFLNDVVDVNHEPGTFDSSLRPNQIFAVGGLPMVLLEGQVANSVVAEVEKKLWTPLGLRSLAPGEAGYRPHYAGGVHDRDSAYHQGTAWPWLLGAFVEAWVRVRGGTNEAKREARSKFLAPILAHLDEGGLGHVSEICDPEPPHIPRGCPFQAWSLGEALRLDRMILAESKERSHRKDAGTANRDIRPNQDVPPYSELTHHEK
jgi:predicted glycogen debranching enzyme